MKRICNDSHNHIPPVFDQVKTDFSPAHQAVTKQSRISSLKRRKCEFEPLGPQPVLARVFTNEMQKKVCLHPSSFFSCMGLGFPKILVLPDNC